MVYGATTIALAALETIVHLAQEGLPLNRYLVRIDIPEAQWAARRTITPETAPAGWDALPSGTVSADYGDQWLGGGMSAILEVPSIVVPEESNVLINPAHPGAAHITATRVRLWTYDRRLRKPAAG